jgi:hypothetical protein
MPYTPEELRELDWYQQLIKADEQAYLSKKEDLSAIAKAMGNQYDESLLIRNEANEVLIFENPYRDELLEDETTMLVHDTRVKRLKNKENDYIVNELLDRGFKEL